MSRFRIATCLAFGLPWVVGCSPEIPVEEVPGVPAVEGEAEEGSLLDLLPAESAERIRRSREMIARDPGERKAFEFLAWSLAWNCTAEVEKPEHVYAFVREGVLVLCKGLEHHEGDPKLLWQIGRILDTHVVRSSGGMQDRFLADDELHAAIGAHVPFEPADVADWRLVPAVHRRANRLDRPPGRQDFMAPVLFHSYVARALGSRADLLIRRGEPDEVVVDAWQQAERAWRELGDVEFDGVRMNDAPGDDRDRGAIEDHEEITNRPYWLERIAVERMTGLPLRRRLYAELKRLGVDDPYRPEFDPAADLEPLRAILDEWPDVFGEEYDPELAELFESVYGPLPAGPGES